MYIFINILIIVVIIFYTVLTLVKFLNVVKKGNAEVANLIVIVIQRHIRNI